MVHLGIKGKAVTFQPLDQVALPQWATGIQTLGVQPRHQRQQLAHPPRARQSGMAHVVIDIKSLVFHPGCIHAHGQARLDLLIEGTTDSIHLHQVAIDAFHVIRGRILRNREQRQPTYMHGGLAGFHHQPAGIHNGQFTGHSPCSLLLFVRSQPGAQTRSYKHPIIRFFSRQSITRLVAFGYQRSIGKIGGQDWQATT